MIMVTGGAGFIGSNFILQWVGEEKSGIVNYDKLTPAGNLNNLSLLEHHPSYHFVRGDLRNRPLLAETLRKYRPSAIIHCAAETPNERSIHHPENFFNKNVLGTCDLLDETLAYWRELDQKGKEAFRFLNVSTNEVYGVSPLRTAYATEETPFSPSKPYSASKASADHFVRSYFMTYGLPTLTTHCSNNFGPFQFPMKLIPLIIVNALKGNNLNILGEGRNTSPWLYVGEHCRALRHVLTKGLPGESYNIGGQAVATNKELIESICKVLDDLNDDSPFRPHSHLIKIVKEHAKQGQYRILDDTKLRNLGWAPKESFEESLRKTVHWYLHHMPWVENVMSGDYKDWIPAIVME